MGALSGGAGLSRKIGVLTATGIVIANMIGSGIFTSSGIMAAQLPGPGWVLLCWALGGVIALSGALSYAELATRMPEAGGEYVYLKRLFHPSLGFLTGWTSFIVGFSAPIALSAMGLIAYLFAGLEHQLGLPPGELDQWMRISAAGVVLLFSMIHYLGTHVGGIVQNVLTAIKIAIIVGISGAGLWATSSGAAQAFRLDAGGGQFAFGAAMMMVMFSYSGWNATAYIAGEVRNPRRSVPISLVAGTLTVAALYLLINIFYFSSAPYDALSGEVAVAERAAVFTFGDWAPTVLTILFGVAMLSSLSAFILIGPRVYYAMARDKLFFPFAARVNPRFGVPGRAVLLQGAIAAFMIAIGSFEQLLIYVGFALGIFPWLAVAGLFIARKRGVGDDTAVSSPMFPLAPVFYLVSSAVLMVFAYIERPFESTFAVVTVLLGVPAYFLWRRGIELATGESG